MLFPGVLRIVLLIVVLVYAGRREFTFLRLRSQPAEADCAESATDKDKIPAKTMASSAEFVGEFGFGEGAEVVI